MRQCPATPFKEIQQAAYYDRRQNERTVIAVGESDNEDEEHVYNVAFADGNHMCCEEHDDAQVLFTDTKVILDNATNLFCIR